jgi:AraC family transcriptional regulator
VSVSAARFAEAAQLVTPGEAAIRVWDPAALEAVHRIARGVAHGGGALGLEALCLELVGAFAGRPVTERRPPGWLVRARELLHDRSQDELTMAAIAAEAGVHPVYLARVFRRFFGETPAEYVRRCRVERAAQLVRGSARPLAEIAVGCGFVDQSHFTRAFGRTFGTSPGAYRRRYRGHVQ